MNVRTIILVFPFIGLLACEDDSSTLGDHCHQEFDCSEGLVCEMDAEGIHGECVEADSE